MPIVIAFRRLFLITFLVLTVHMIFAQQMLGPDSLEVLLEDRSSEQQVELLKDLVNDLPFDQKEDYLQLAITLARDRQLTSQEAALYIVLGMSHYGKGDYSKTLENYHKALDLYENLEDYSGMGRCYNELSIFVKKQKDYEKAAEYLDRSLEYCQLAGDSIGVSTSYDNRGLLHAEQGQWSEAEANYLKALDIRRDVRDSVGLGYVYNNLAEVEVEKKNFQKAIDWIEKSTNIRRQLKDSTGLAINSTNVGELYFKRGDFHRAAQYFEESLDFSRRIAYLDLSRWNLEYASRCYARLGETEKALEYLSRSYELKDSLLSAARIRELAEMETRYETEKKEQQIQLQQLELDNQAQRYRARLGIAAGILIFLALLAAIVFIYYRNRQRILLRDERENYQQQLLDNTLEVQEFERKRIAKDLHDGIGQQLTGLKMAWQNLSEDLHQQAPGEEQQLQKLSKILEETATDVRNISHQMMPRALQELGLIPALEDLVDQSFTNTNIRCEFDHHGIEQRLEEKSEINLYRIIQELINNILKHANATEVGIQMYKNKGQLIAVIEDNGRGFSTGTLKANSHGMMNISSRIQALQGEVDFQSTPGQGTLTTLRIPLATNSHS